MVLTRYSLPTACKYSFVFFLKSTNAKYSIIPPNGHSTATLTLLIQALKSFCPLLRCAPLKGPWTWIVTGYAGCPCMQYIDLARAKSEAPINKLMI